MRVLLIVILVLALAAGGYFLYDFVKKTPPDWLIGFATKREEPSPLPPGNAAPFSVPEGFQATIFSRDVPGVRVITRDPRAVIVASLTSEGKVVALPDVDGNGVADATGVILEGLNKPHGIAFMCPDGEPCFLYVAETDALKRYAYDSIARRATYEETVMTFPFGRGHFTRTLLVSPNNRDLLVSIGSSCNVCDETEPLRATIAAYDPLTKESRVVATGLRNSVFMTTHPVTGDVWATDNGRDLLGDDTPPDEVNIIRDGKDYGWPICFGKNVHDTDFDKKQYVRDPCADREPAHLELPAHSAALGLAFIPEEGWPEEMWHDLLVAYHGSWNRSDPTGYKVVRIELTPEGEPVAGGVHDFMTGFLPEGARPDDALGRPVAFYIEPGGSLFVSDDRAGAIYHVTSTREP